MRQLASTPFLTGITVLSLILQPLVTSADCWQMAVADEKCPADCSMQHEPDSRHSNRARAADPDCCEITSSEPTILAVAAAAPQVPVQGTLTSLGSLSHVERPAAPSLPEGSPPRRVTASLTTLYCTFLI